MFNLPIPTPRGTHADEVPTASGYWDAEADAHLGGVVTIEHLAVTR